MTTYGAFSSSMLGMMSQSHALNTIGTNIANVNTGAYKRTETRFATLLSDSMFNQSDLGGITTKDYQMIDLSGPAIVTNRDMDVAINGKGFLVLSTALSGGTTYYGRDGSFTQTNSGTSSVTADDGSTITVNNSFLADKNGYFVQGWTADPTTGLFPSTSTLSSLRMDEWAFANNFRATTSADLRLNIPSTAAANDVHVYSVEVFDSKGAEQAVTLNFTKSSTINQWSLTATTSQLPVAQVDTVTLGGTPEGGGSYSVIVNDLTTKHTVTAGQTLADVATALAATINANSNVNSVVTAAAGAGGTITLTAKAAGTAMTSSASAAFANNVAQVDNVTLGGTVEANDKYTITINNTAIAYTAAGGNTLNDVRDQLIGLINASGVNGAVTASSGGAGIVTITSDTAGTAFTATPSVLDVGGNPDNAATLANATPNFASANDNTAASAVTTANVPNLQTTAAQTLTFDQQGAISSTNPVTLALGFANSGTATVAFDMSNLTQFAGDFTPFGYEKNGFGASRMTSASFDMEGHIIGFFEDLTSRAIYKLPLASFTNPNGMEMKNGNVFAVTENSGTARVAAASAGGPGTFVPAAREMSNVDIADEFTLMIMTQNAYNSSATVFRTVDEMTQTARDLKR